jgi:hypothetical protein
MNTVVDVIKNQGATHNHYTVPTYVAKEKVYIRYQIKNALNMKCYLVPLYRLSTQIKRRVIVSNSQTRFFIL